jgi:hypothetical protein
LWISAAALMSLDLRACGWLSTENSHSHLSFLGAVGSCSRMFERTILLVPVLGCDRFRCPVWPAAVGRANLINPSKKELQGARCKVQDAAALSHAPRRRRLEKRCVPFPNRILARDNSLSGFLPPFSCRTSCRVLLRLVLHPTSSRFFLFLDQPDATCKSL